MTSDLQKMILIIVVCLLLDRFPFMSMQFILNKQSFPCKYTSESHEDDVSVFDTLWNITDTKFLYQIVYSPCKRALITTCDKNALVCITNLRDSKKLTFNAGQSFDYIELENDGEENGLVLKSKGGEPCDENKNYSLIIHFACYSSIKIEPTLLREDGCEFHVEMMDSKCIPRCTAQVQGNLFDLRHLKKLEDVFISTGSKSFAISYCGSAKRCQGVGIWACEITNNTNTELADVKSQHIVYSSANGLTVRGHYGVKRFRIFVEIHLKCNWNVNFSNEKYKVPSQQGKNYKFEVESMYGCVKTPMNCLVAGSSGFTYNLSKLHNVNGYWQVGKVTDGDLFLNLCGALKVPVHNNRCPEHSQVCLYLTKSQEFVNIGSVPSEVLVSTSDTIKTTFKDGATCNFTNLYETVIELVCSQTEKGPVLLNINSCTYNIVWETPAACPQQIVSRSDCIVTDLTGQKNLNGLHSSFGRIYHINSNSFLRYNLCGSLKSCRNYSNASICYIIDGQEYVIGWLDKTLTSVNGLLQFNLIGERCTETSPWEIHVFVHCNYSVPNGGVVGTNMTQLGCLFTLDLHSPLACATQPMTDCKIRSGDSVIDLSPLALKHDNYIVKNISAGVDYILNICQPIVNNKDISCPTNSSSCLRKETEPHLKHRFISLGRMSGPILVKNEVVIKNNHGTYCRSSGMYSTIIHFYCSKEEALPKLLNTGTCSYEFVWNTSHACPKTVFKRPEHFLSGCKLTDNANKSFIDLTNLSNTLLDVVAENDYKYKFNLCENNYTMCTSEDHCKIIPYVTTPEFINDSTGPHIHYKLQTSCSGPNKADILNVMFECDPTVNEQRFINDGIKDCKLNVKVKIGIACPPMNDLVRFKKQVALSTTDESINLLKQESLPNIENGNNKVIRESDISTQKVVDNIDSAAQLKISDCTVKNNDTNFIFNLSEVQPFQVVSAERTSYTINLIKLLPVCQGYICKDNVQMASPKNICPHVQFNYSHSVVKLRYESFQMCGNNANYRSELWLKCNSTNYLPYVVEESICNVILEYPSKEACLLLEKPVVQSSSATLAAIGSSVLVLFLVIGVVVVYVVIKNPEQRCSTTTRRHRSKEAIPICSVYYRNARM